MKMEETECSETSAYKIQTPGNYPEENTQHTEHGESLKSRRFEVLSAFNFFMLAVIICWCRSQISEMVTYSKDLFRTCVLWFCPFCSQAINMYLVVFFLFGNFQPSEFLYRIFGTLFHLHRCCKQEKFLPAYTKLCWRFGTFYVFRLHMRCKLEEFLLAYTTYEDGTDRVFRNVGT